MQYRRLGKSNLLVSRLWLGGMSLGSPSQRPWVADAATSTRMIAEAIEAGINTIDTADAYGKGESEELIGSCLHDMGVRDDIVVATKFGLPIDGNKPNRSGYSRKNIIQRCEAALKRLKTDRIDILQTHIWQPDSSIEEVIGAFHHLVRQGKVLYVGTTDMPPWQAAKWIFTKSFDDLPPLISVQHHYNPVWREDERFLVPLCEAEGVGMVAYSPLGRGFLAGAARGTTREKTDDFIGKFYGRTADLAIQGKIEKLAEKAGVTPAQLSLLWVLRQRYITSAVVGPTNSKQLSELVQCTETRIADDVFDEISATYSPRMEVGHG